MQSPSPSCAAPFPDLFADLLEPGLSAPCSPSLPLDDLDPLALLPDLTRSASTQDGQAAPLLLLPPRGQLDAASNSGDLPEQSAAAGQADEVQRHKEKNRAAQKRFRQRQKARVAASAQQAQELAAALRRLQLEKQQLEAQNRVLQATVRLSRHHIQDTAAEQAAFAQQQERILMETGSIYWRGMRSQPLSLADAKAVTMEAFLNIFEHFLGQLRPLLEAGGRDPSTPAGRELRSIVLARRQEEARAAMFSHWASAAYAWNREETDAGLQPPSQAFWAGVLDALELSPEQQEALLAAQRRLLAALAPVRRERERMVLELGLAVLQQRAGGGNSPQERQLRECLEAERVAVDEFLYTIVEGTFEPWQEVTADLRSHPWHPDLWALCSILAARAPGSEPPDVSTATGTAAALLPHFSPAEMLWRPLLARGGGLQLKRVLLAKETPTDVLAAAARPQPSIAQLRGMSMFDIFCGRHLELPRDAAENGPQFAPAFQRAGASTA